MLYPSTLFCDVVHSRSATSSTGSGAKKFQFGSREKCVVCGKTVYPREKLVVDFQVRLVPVFNASLTLLQRTITPLAFDVNTATTS